MTLEMTGFEPCHFDERSEEKSYRFFPGVIILTF
jgi:hypothetical protein